MYNKKWNDLRKVDENYVLEPEFNSRAQHSLGTNFAQLSFDWNEELLIVTDTIGYLYLIDLTNSCPSYKKLENIGQSTFVAFNPLDNSEILVGLTTGDIKLLRINANTTPLCLLSAHKLPTTHISFYKSYCLTCSRKEVIIWCLRSCSKAHQLRVNIKNVAVKKAKFSNLGHIVVLYHNDTIQAWDFKQLENDTKIDAKNFGLRNIKDFVFTRNGRAMIMVSVQNKVVILHTSDWNLMQTLSLPENCTGIKQLSVVPLPLDGGANKIIACLSTSCILNFLDLSKSCFIDTLRPIKIIKKLAVSSNGRYVAYIEKEGNLKLTITEKLFSEKCKQSRRIQEPCKSIAHGISNHLKYIRQSMKQELCLERLMPILKEFGEYPEKYRVIIWSTILKLPANKCAYSALANKAVFTESTSELLNNYPLANRNAKTLLMTMMNCLIQWCPSFVQSTFLPDLIFPFLMVFQKDLLLGFELILHILLNYCQKWFEYHPLPPLNILGIAENILLEADPTLLNTFCECGVISSEYIWPLLKTAMSEVLSGSEWLILWDHLITFQKPSLLLMCAVAYGICSREIIIPLAYSPERIKQVFTTQGHVRAKDLLKIAEKLDKDTPFRIHPNRYLRDKLIMLPATGCYPPFILEDFPKLLTEDLSIVETEKFKEKERTVRERNQRTIEIAEKRRLRQEMNAFVNKIHETRLNEIQQCIKEQSHDLYWDKKTVIHKPKVEKIERYHNVGKIDLDMESDEDAINRREHQLKNYERLQQDVDKLEYEVQSLLDSLKTAS